MAETNAVALTDFLAAALAACVDALVETPFGRPPAVMLSHGPMPDDRHCLVAHVDSWTPIAPAQFPQAFQGAETRAKVWAAFMPSLTLSLRRPCAPMPTDNAADPFPRPEAITEHAMKLSHDATALTCVAVPAIERLLKTAHPVSDARIAWGSLLPRRGADSAGWELRAVLEWGCGCG